MYRYVRKAGPNPNGPLRAPFRHASPLDLIYTHKTQPALSSRPTTLTAILPFQISPHLALHHALALLGLGRRRGGGGGPLAAALVVTALGPPGLLPVARPGRPRVLAAEELWGGG